MESFIHILYVLDDIFFLFMLDLVLYPLLLEFLIFFNQKFNYILLIYFLKMKELMFLVFSKKSIKV